MYIRYFTIAGGNNTALVAGVAPDSQLAVAHTLLTTVEQVGFIEPGAIPQLTMMGGELCINALLAYVSMQEKTHGAIRIHSQDVTYTKTETTATITLALPTIQTGSTVLFDSIGYFVTDKTESFPKAFFRTQAETHHLPAFGVIHTMDDGSIVPQVYVKATDSLVTETSCGSGSVAFSIITGVSRVVQPTQQHITITTKAPDIYTICASVAEYGETTY